MGRSGRVGRRAGRVGVCAKRAEIPVIRAVSLPIPLQIAESVADSRPRSGEQTATAGGRIHPANTGVCAVPGPMLCGDRRGSGTATCPCARPRSPTVALRSLLACAHLAPPAWSRIRAVQPFSSARFSTMPALGSAKVSIHVRTTRPARSVGSAIWSSHLRGCSSVHARGARSAVVAQASCHTGRDCAAIRARPLPRTSCCAMSASCAFVRVAPRESAFARRCNLSTREAPSAPSRRAPARGHRADARSSAPRPQPEGGQLWPSVPLSPASSQFRPRRDPRARERARAR